MTFRAAGTGGDILRSGRSPTHEMHDFEAVVGADSSFRPRYAADDLAIEFYRDAVGLKLQNRDNNIQRGRISNGFKSTRLAIQLDDESFRHTFFLA